MPIPEAQLETWAKLGSIAQSAATYETIKTVIESKDAPYAGRSPTSFLQGSYGNHTNVYGVDSDVDIVLRCGSVFYYGLSDLSEGDKQLFQATHPTNADYRYADFKKDVTTWLEERFGDDLDPGEKAIRILAGGGRRDADVLPCVQYRRYLKFDGVNDTNYVPGITFFMPDGTQIINYPTLHKDNCIQKQNDTNSYFKATVRIAKNMRNRMVADGSLEAGLAPSYYLEGLFYNVPSGLFGGNYQNTFTEAITWLLETDRSKLVCANEQYMLLWEDSPVTWRAEKCDTFLNAVVEFWNDW